MRVKEQPVLPLEIISQIMCFLNVPFDHATLSNFARASRLCHALADRYLSKHLEIRSGETLSKCLSALNALIPGERRQDAPTPSQITEAKAAQDRLDRCETLTLRYLPPIMQLKRIEGLAASLDVDCVLPGVKTLLITHNAISDYNYPRDDDYEEKFYEVLRWMRWLPRLVDPQQVCLQVDRPLYDKVRASDLIGTILKRLTSCRSFTCHAHPNQIHMNKISWHNARRDTPAYLRLLPPVRDEARKSISKRGITVYYTVARRIESFWEEEGSCWSRRETRPDETTGYTGREWRNSTEATIIDRAERMGMRYDQRLGPCQGCGCEFPLAHERRWLTRNGGNQFS